MSIMAADGPATTAIKIDRTMKIIRVKWRGCWRGRMAVTKPPQNTGLRRMPRSINPYEVTREPSETPSELHRARRRRWRGVEASEARLVPRRVWRRTVRLRAWYLYLGLQYPTSTHFGSRERACMG